MKKRPEGYKTLRQRELEKWENMSTKERAQAAFNNPLAGYGATCYCTGGHFPLAACPYAFYPDEATFINDDGEEEYLYP